MPHTSTRSPEINTSFEDVYVQLRCVARSLMLGERGSHSLDPTDLVHEFMMKLGFDRMPDPGIRQNLEFIAYARKVMRNMLIDHARKRLAVKRGGGIVRRLGDAVSLIMFDGDGRGVVVPDVFDLHDALDALEQSDPDLANIVTLRFCFGLALREIASLLDCSVSSVKRRSDEALETIRTRIDPPRVN